jgi:hypothetical protein
MALDPMETVSFHCRQAVLLGTAGLAMLLGYEVWIYGWFWASDTLSVWMLSVILVLVFVTIVGSPLQLLCQTASRLLAVFVGAISGPLAVVLALSLASRHSFTYERYVSDFWLYHVIFSGLGAAHAVMFQNWLSRKRDAADNMQSRGV